MNKALRGLIKTLAERRRLSRAEYGSLIRERTPEAAEYLASLAVRERKRVYGDAVYARGLLAISNICKNDCLYCGIRKSNARCERYRLTPEQIVSCAEEGCALGFRTFVLQGGEDAYFTDDVFCPQRKDATKMALYNPKSLKAEEFIFPRR